MKAIATSMPILAVLVGLLAPPPARAQVAGAPATIDYQGEVLDAAGVVLAPSTPTNYTMQFRIYNQQTGGSIVWAESQIVTVDQGVFSVRLGTGVRIPASGGGDEGTTTDLRQAFNATDRYLGLTVVIPGQTPMEITPRLAFLSAPFSLVAERAKLADAATTANLVNQTMGSSTLSTATINNFTLAGPGRVNGTNVLEFGAGVAGKHANAGKVNYNTAAGSLDLVGAGTTGTNRKIHLFAEGGLLIDGPATANSLSLIGSAPPERLTVGSFTDARDNYISVDTTGGNTRRSGIRLRHFNSTGGFTIESDERHSPAGADGLNFIENVAPATSRMLIRKGGNVGIGNTLPPERLSVGSFADARDNYISVDTAGGNTQRAGIRLRHFDANNGFTIESDERDVPANVKGLNFIENPGTTRMVIKKGGNVGIGTTSPGFPLSFPSTTGDKIALWGESGNHFGFGVADSLLQIHTNQASTDIAFGYGTSATMTETMRIKGNGRVGIGTTAPVAPLHVGLVASRNVSGWWFAGNGLAAINGPLSVSIKADGAVEAASYVSTSDFRIKNIVERSDSREDLRTLQKLLVTDYRLKDRAAQGDALQKGFIAQEVQTLIPEAVRKGSGYIPDIYAVAEILEPVGQAGTLRLRLDKAHGLKNGDVVRLITDDGAKEHAVAEIQDDHTFLVGGFAATPERVFVFGRQVDDFLSVDYNRIFTTGISAIQQLKKEKDEENQALTEQNSALTRQLAAAEKRLAALEAQVTRLAAVAEKAEMKTVGIR